MNTLDPFLDPITGAWLLGLAILFLVAVVVPIGRLVAATCIYAYAALTGRAHLRAVAHRVMPSIAHLIGGLVVGTASIAAPAFALGSDHAADAISIDRDAAPAAAATNATDPAAAQREIPRAARDIDAVAPVDAGRVYVVQAGDCLWDIAASQLEEPTDREVTDAWKAIWRANRAVIGDHPELIHPGQRLVLEDPA